MGRYALASLARGALTLMAVSFIVFMLSRLTGNPMDVLAPENLGADDEAALKAKWGLDKSLPQQYFASSATPFRVTSVRRSSIRRRRRPR